MKTSTFARLTAAFAALLSVAVWAEAQPATEIALDHEALGKAATIAVTVNGKTYPFLFDTGSGVTVVSPEVAKEAGCVPFGRVSGLETLGKRVDLERCDGITLQAGGHSAKMDTAVRNIMPFFSPQTPRIGGVISLSAFAGRAVTVDLKKNRLIVETDATLLERTAGMRKLRTRVSRPFAGIGLEVLAEAATPNGNVWVQFDTGNTNWSHISPHSLRQMGISLDAPNKAKTVKPVTLDLIGFGGFEFMARERDLVHDVRLNYDTLTTIVYTVDLRSGEMWMKVN